MAKKKLLTESQVRRFMGLAGLEPIHTNKVVKEMNEASMYEEEPMPDEEMPPEAAGEEEMPPEEPIPEPEAEEPAAAGEVELSPEDIKAARDAVEKLLAPLEAEMPDEAGEEPELGEPAEEVPVEEPVEEPAPAPDEEEQEVMEALSGIDLQLNEDELVQEVAKRVAKRLLRAKKAQKQLDEALGRKK